MALIALPDALRLNEIDPWRLQTQTAGPGMGLNSVRQFIARENRVWAGRYQVRGAWDSAHGAFYAFLDQLRGPLNSFVVPVTNFAALRGPVGGFVFLTDGGDFVMTDGGAEFVVLDDDPDPVVATSAVVGAMQIALSGIDGLFLVPGAFFSHGDWLYRVAANVDGLATFNPPLRAPIASGQRLNVLAPTIRVRMASDEAAAQAHQPSRRRGPFTFSVTEAFDR
jgi:hypothetical protein